MDQRGGWYKSSHSGGSGQGACVEVASTADGVMLRDSKDPAGPVHRFDIAVWRTFIAAMRAGAHHLNP
jgi:hypothetical protein